MLTAEIKQFITRELPVIFREDAEIHRFGEEYPRWFSLRHELFSSQNSFPIDFSAQCLMLRNDAMTPFAVLERTLKNSKKDVVLSGI